MTSSGSAVLVVEDNEAMREVMCRLLLHSGYRVFSAATGVEALQLARTSAHEIHLLVTSAVLPGGLGKELADQIRDFRPTTHVLYLSGCAEQVLVNSGTLDPGATLLEAPFSQAGLLTKVEEAVARS